MGGCGGSSNNAARTTTVQPVASSTTDAAASASGTQLAALLIMNPPPDFVVQPDSVGDTGPSDLAKAASDDGKPDATTALTADGFVAGYQRLWATQDNRRLIVFLYQFRDAAGAAAYRKRTIDNDASDPTNRAAPSPVSSIPGAVALISASQPSVVVVLFAKGSYLVQIVGDAPTGARALAEEMAKQQYGRL